MGDFIPLPDFDQNDADIILLPMFKGMVQYYEPVEDPLFSAHKELTETDLGYIWRIQNACECLALLTKK
jgi:hypothetical protein